MAKRALITGITGQDGSYLSELLLSKGYEVHGLVRRASTFNTHRLEHIYQDPHDPAARLFFHYGDVTDGAGLRRVLTQCRPDEIYHLAAQSHVRVSFNQPVYSAQVDAVGVLRLLEAVRDTALPTRIFNAATSEMFGRTPPPQNEQSPFAPLSPHGCAKLFAYWQMVNYREAYGVFTCNGIMFNHESPRRGETFITRKITRAATRIAAGLQDKLYVGNLEARRDWGFAGDYVEAMWRMLQQDQPGDYVLATGETHTVREFMIEAFNRVGLDWQKHVEIDPHYFRPTDVEDLCGDATKAAEQLDWKPTTYFKDLVKLMIDADTQLAQNEKLIRDTNGDDKSE
jgi:GDPmannose 4,6-dehydratase